VALLDTTFLSDLLREKREAIDLLEQLRSEGRKLTTTTLNLAELYSGAYRLAESAGRVHAVEQFAEALVLLDFDVRSAKVFGELEAYLTREGKSVPVKDLLIASTGLSHGEHVVLTRNRKDFERIPGIEVRPY